MQGHTAPSIPTGWKVPTRPDKPADNDKMVSVEEPDAKVRFIGSTPSINYPEFGSDAHEAVETYSIVNEMPPEYQAKFSTLTPLQQEDFINLLKSTGLSFNEFIKTFVDAQKVFDEFADTFNQFNRVFEAGTDFDPKVHNQKNLDRAYLRHKKAVEKRKKRKRGGHK